MAWETRKGRGTYFARTVRVGGRFVRLYFGKGLIAKEAALWVEAQRRAQAECVRDEEAWWNRLRAADRRSRRLLAYLERLTDQSDPRSAKATTATVTKDKS